MSDEAETRQRIRQRAVDAIKASEAELTANPAATLGACWVSSAGYSECVGTMTEEACNRQKADGYTVNWKKDEKC